MLRVIYADGGYFVAGSEYGDFLVNRFDPGSPNGRAARLKEIAEGAAKPIPRTQEEMRRLLALEIKLTSQPQQIDFAL
ncbi:MAG TPA: hypothetical protein VMV89_00135 [Candidatus Paceibacterota bacterium]|nr:hypothetical protein [Candidatus Paceibacterota bacterium]